MKTEEHFRKELFEKMRQAKMDELMTTVAAPTIVTGNPTGPSPWERVLTQEGKWTNMHEIVKEMWSREEEARRRAALAQTFGERTIQERVWVVPHEWNKSLELRVFGRWTAHPTSIHVCDEDFLLVGRTRLNETIKIDRMGGATQIQYERDSASRKSIVSVGLRFCVPEGKDPSWVETTDAREALVCLDALLIQRIERSCTKAMAELADRMRRQDGKLSSIREQNVVDLAKAASNSIINHVCPLGSTKLYQLWGGELPDARYSKSAMTEQPEAAKPEPAELLPNQGIW